MPRYTDIEDAATYVDVENPQKVGLLEKILEGVETFVESYTGRRFAPDPALAAGGADSNPAVTKTLYVSPYQTSVRVPDLRVVTSITLGGSIVTQYGFGVSGGYELSGSPPDVPASHLTLRTPAYMASPLVITGRWGWNPVPHDLLDAIYTHSARRWRERDAQYADNVTTADGMTFAYFRSMPANVKATYDLYRVAKFEYV